MLVLMWKTAVALLQILGFLFLLFSLIQSEL